MTARDNLKERLIIKYKFHLKKAEKLLERIDKLGGLES